MAKADACYVCDTVPVVERVELDTLMSDPSLWPANVWGKFTPPEGLLPPRYRSWGAIGVGKHWLDTHGYANISRNVLEKHFRNHIPEVPYSREALVERGVVRELTEEPDLSKYDATKFLRMYSDGIELGLQALADLRERIAKYHESGQEVPMPLLKLALEQGAKFALSQASIKASGRMIHDTGDEEEGFRAGSAPLPGPRFGSVRLREVEGEVRPVVDEGRADRLDYNERARQEGKPLLPA
jgi:hypothetical protein